MWAGEHGGDADAIIAAKGLEQISDAGAIEKIVDDVLAANAAIVAEFRAGKEKAFQSLVGKAMAATKGTRRSGAGQRGAQEEARGELTGRQSIVPYGRRRTERERPTPMNILGMTGPALHDTSAALFVDGKLVAAAEEERFIRIKHAKRRQPVNAIKFYLAQAGIRPHEVDVVAYPYVHVGLTSPARWHYARRHWYEPHGDCGRSSTATGRCAPRPRACCSCSTSSALDRDARGSCRSSITWRTRAAPIT